MQGRVGRAQRPDAVHLRADKDCNHREARSAFGRLATGEARVAAVTRGLQYINNTEAA